jgi:aerobic carbon-monoxide dehydrogenase small subunit
LAPVLEVGGDEDKEISLEVNGSERSGKAHTRTLLVHFLRDELGLTGTHVGCDTGHCGACTVMMDGKTVKSCMVLAIRARGSRVTTVEGLAQGGKLHPVQEAFSENHGLQCGYCTPGLLMSTVFLLERNEHPSEEEIRRAIEGNLCRCTGYVNVVKSIREAARRIHQNPDGEAR